MKIRIRTLLLSSLLLVACGSSSGPILWDISGSPDGAVGADLQGDGTVVAPDISIPLDSIVPADNVEVPDVIEMPDVPPDVCIADCAGKECGDDGCGGDCGTCPAIAPICDAGVCQLECEPNCEGKECGTDGCVGSCGECVEGVFCNEGICEEQCISDEGCLEAGLTECTESGELRICEEVAPECLKWDEPAGCDDGYHCEDGECVETCMPDCDGLECGGDGCGGSCGDCDEGSFCEAGICQEVCNSDEGCTEDGLTECTEDGELRECEEVEPDCLKWSEPEPCGEGWLCLDGECIEICLPDCGGSECGSDGCDGSCGNCGVDETCLDGQCWCDHVACGDVCCSEGESCIEGLCGIACVPQCGGKECGLNGCGGSCGACEANQFCTDGVCTNVCEPDCFLKECGDDGCEGSCGACDAGVICTVAGSCGGECLECNGDPACSFLEFAEGTLANWNIDAAVILPNFGETVAPTAGNMLKLTTGEGLTVTDSEVHFQTCLEPGDYGVIVDWKFYSEEFKNPLHWNKHTASIMLTAAHRTPVIAAGKGCAYALGHASPDINSVSLVVPDALNSPGSAAHLRLAEDKLGQRQEPWQ